ncbi:hypothetical protein K4L44_01280 [Halosquirtibacter laminarini]|uniref:Uncharacterized protein n=1 Tax=Halosquirtibacter laminarini TaxID=3374600 RepID=A0AC61NPQ2_9BACT|nr:hypothetical protein K4L44_01280 [Prolixibacteraceae bacterium]
MSTIKISLVLTLAILMSFTSCKKDEDTLPIGKKIENSELQTILKEMGYSFDANNKLVMNDKAQNTKTLNLSGKQLSSYKGLDIFPSLEEINLSDNLFTEFDFNKLPTTVTKVELQGNKLYSFSNLLQSNQINKLYLPETAKYNDDEVLKFYLKHKDIDMKIMNVDKMIKYTTLRTIPDIQLRSFLKTQYASLFTDSDQIDISKELTIQEAGEFNLGNLFMPFPEEITTLEGIQYVIRKVTGAININLANQAKISYLKFNPSVSAVMINNVDFTDAEIDFSNIENLFSWIMGQCPGIKKIDLSKSNKLGIKGIEIPFAGLAISGCEDLEEIVMKKIDELSFNAVIFENLPKLKSLNLKNLIEWQPSMVFKLTGLSNCKLTLPTKIKKDANGEKRSISIDKTISETKEGKKFLENNKDVLSVEIVDNKKSFKLHTDAIDPNMNHFTGVLEPTMNGDKYNNVQKTFKVTWKDNNKLDIELDGFKVGRMPGSVSIDIKDADYTTNQNGEKVFAGNYKKAVVMNMGIFTFRFDAAYSGHVQNNKLYFEIHSTGNVLWKTIKADIVFNRIQ